MTDIFDFRTNPPRVAVVQSATAYDPVFCKMMARLRMEFGTRFVLLSFDPDIRRRYGEFLAPEDKVIDLNAVDAAATAAAADEATVFAKARHYEAAYDISYLRDIVQQDRRLSPQMLSNAPYYPLPPGEFPPLPVLAARINAWFDQAEQWMDAEGVDLVLGRPDGLVGAPLVFAAEKRGIPVTVPVSARYKGRAAWTFGGYRLGHFIRQAAESLEALPADHETDAGAVRYNSIGFNNLDTMARPMVLAKKIAKSAVIRVAMMIEDLRAWRRPQRTSFVTEMRRTINVYRVARWLERHSVPVDELKKQPFVLYLMNVEPEFGSHAVAREFWNSAAIIQQLALSLPMGYRLVIKDHGPGVGNRSLSYYRQIAKFPNVVFADYRLKGTDLAIFAESMATISGTIGYEGSLMGKTVICFTERTVYDWLPSIIRVDNIRDLPARVREALRKRSDAEIADIRHKAALLYEGVKATSFEASGSCIFKGGKRPLTEDELDQAYDLLLRNAALQRKVFGWKPVSGTAAA